MPGTIFIQSWVRISCSAMRKEPGSDVLFRRGEHPDDACNPAQLGPFLGTVDTFFALSDTSSAIADGMLA